MIFVDSNIPMYLVGRNRDWQLRARHLLERVVFEGERLVTDTEVLQEILHRYLAICRPEFIEPAYRVLFDICDEILPVDADIMTQAKDLALREFESISARDAIHLAVMRKHHIGQLMSYDKDFDRFGVQRLS